MLQLARGIAAIGAGPHWEAFEHLRRLFAPAHPAFNSGVQFLALADFVDAAVYSDHAQTARSVIDEMECVSAPRAVAWVETMLSYGKAQVATNECGTLLAGSWAGRKELAILARAPSAQLGCVAAPAAQTRQRAGSTARGRNLAYHRLRLCASPFRRPHPNVIWRHLGVGSWGVDP